MLIIGLVIVLLIYIFKIEIKIYCTSAMPINKKFIWICNCCMIYSTPYISSWQVFAILTFVLSNLHFRQIKEETLIWVTEADKRYSSQYLPIPLLALCYCLRHGRKREQSDKIAARHAYLKCNFGACRTWNCRNDWSKFLIVVNSETANIGIILRLPTTGATWPI